MGIRIHKMCGWALTDLVGEGEDARVDWGSPVFSYDLTSAQHLERYLEFLDSKDDGGGVAGSILDRAIVRDKRRAAQPDPDMQAAFQWGTADGGSTDVLCIRPLTCEDWYRYDDILDWLEADDMNPVARVLEHGIFPWSGSYMDSTTGQRLPHEVMDWVRLWTNIAPADRPTVRKAVKSELDELAGTFGMTHDEAEFRVAPLVPEDIRNLCEYAEVFTNPDVWLQLRPVIYTWWA